MLQANDTIEIRPFEPHSASRTEWAAYQVYRRLRAAEDVPDLPLLEDAEFEQFVRRQEPLVENRRLVALRGHEIVGNVMLTTRREGTPQYEDYAPYLDVSGGVARQHRRRGIARTLAQSLHAFMRDHGKSMATVKANLPEGHAFLAATGAIPKLRSMENRLEFGTLDWTMLAAWQAQVATANPPLRWEIHPGRVPMERLAELIRPMTRLINEAPLGELDIPPIRYDLVAYEAWYAEMDRRGGEHYLVALNAGDALVAVCDASWDQRFPDRVYQALTAVAAPWRGKGLAKAVKAAMLLALRQRRPEVTMLITTNAQANAPMLSINRRLGFEVHREECTYQIGQAALAAFLGRPARPRDAGVS